MWVLGFGFVVWSLRVWDLGLRVWGLEFGVWGLGFGIGGLKFGVSGFEIGFRGSFFISQDSRFRVSPPCFPRLETLKPLNFRGRGSSRAPGVGVEAGERCITYINQSINMYICIDMYI